MNKRLGNIFNTKIRIALGMIALVVLIGFTQVSQSDMTCESLVISLENNLGNHFLTEDEVVDILTVNGTEPVEGLRIGTMDLKRMEKRLNDNPYVDYGEIFHDLPGNLVVTVRLKKPVARIVSSKLPDAYVTENGDLMPVSDDFSSRVVLISGSMVDSLTRPGFIGKHGTELLELVNFINDDDFWRAQISEIEYNRKGKVILYPQITRARIEFGRPEDLEKKFKRLMLFYKDVLPREGWNKYTRVNLEYKDQIIAE